MSCLWTYCNENGNGRIEVKLTEDSSFWWLFSLSRFTLMIITLTLQTWQDLTDVWLCTFGRCSTAHHFTFHFNLFSNKKSNSFHVFLVSSRQLEEIMLMISIIFLVVVIRPYRHPQIGSRVVKSVVILVVVMLIVDCLVCFVMEKRGFGFWL